MINSHNLDRLYFTAFSDVVQPRSEKAESIERFTRLEKMTDRKALLAEALVLADQIVFEVNGPNLVMPLLVQWFGYKKLSELIDEDVLTFAYCPGTAAYISIQSKKQLELSCKPGLNRIIGDNPAWSDPYESVLLALNEQTNLKRSSKRDLARRSAKKTITLPAESIFEEAFRLADADRHSTLGINLGFDENDNPLFEDLNNPKVRSYLDLAHHNLGYLNMVLSGCNDIIANDLAYMILKNRLTIDSTILDRVRISNTVLEYEYVPDLRSLVSKDLLTMEEVLQIRGSKSIGKFRNWLRSIPTNSKDLEIIRAYQQGDCI